MAKKETKAKSEDPEAVERRRLKRMAVSKGIISEAPLKESSTTLTPSKTVVKHHGKDIVKKSQRKNRFLFSFPGLLAPIGGGKIGELKDLGTKNPILYLHFPQGMMKLFGTIMYPKNRYLTLQFSRGGKNVMCEDSFDTMIVFSDAWWIGNKEENPEEARLEFPKELAGHPSECDFRGGAGSTTENKSNVNNSVQNFVKEQTPETDVDDESSKSENNATELPKQTPTRHSARTSGKSYKFAEAFSSDDEIDADVSKISEEKSEEKESNMIITSTSNAKETLTKAPKVSKSSSKAASSISRGSGGSLVQPTISTLFKKAEEKKEPTNSKNITPLTAVDPKPQSAKSARRIDLDETSETRKKRQLVKGSDSKTTKTNPEDEDDVIEEFSSSSQDTYGSDQDWAGDL